MLELLKSPPQSRDLILAILELEVMDEATASSNDLGRDLQTACPLHLDARDGGVGTVAELDLYKLVDALLEARDDGAVVAVVAVD